MAQRRRIKTLPDSSSDLISNLPVEIKDRILERLPIRDAARTALLSTHWNDAWLQHGRLAFDSKFFWRFGKSKGRSSLVPYVKIITYILLQRVRPVKKFSLFICYSKLFDPKLEQSDLDQWFRFLSRNGVEELDIYLGGSEYKLPFCIFSCPTLKQLILCSVRFDFPLNVPCIFPCVTSLIFARVSFNHNVNGIVYSIPNLEKLDLSDCGGIDNFKISAPKLESLSITGFTCEVESGWVAVHLKAIKVLCLEGSLLLGWGDAVASFPTAINLQVIRLRSVDFDIERQLKGVVLLLQKSPNLCELDITGDCSYYDMQNDDMENDHMEDDHMEDDHIEAPSSLLKDPESCVINQDLKMLKTIEIGHFRGSTLEMLLVKMLLSKSPILESVVITESYYIKDGNTVIKFLRELLCFPRASPKAQIVIKGKDYA